MKRTIITTLIALVVGAGIYLGISIYINHLEKVNQALDRSIFDGVYFNGQELRAFNDLRPEALGNRAKKFLLLDMRDKFDLLQTCDFSTLTKWPARERLPNDFQPQAIIEEGKDPGLGIRALHSQGITGKGVHVAIHDFPLLREHTEYKDRIVQYRLTNGKDPATDRSTSMHGTAVASLLVGKTCGVAPEAPLHFWAKVEADYDYQSAINAVEEVLVINRNKPKADQIRVFSISLGLNPEIKNYKEWIDTIKKAKANGLIVIFCHDEIMGVGCPLGKNRNDPANYRLCYFGQPGERPIPADTIYIPIDNRTMADPNGPNEYYFTAKGGGSWAAPYLAGIIALGLQVNPDLSQDEILRLILETGTPFNNGKLVNPPAFIQKIRSMQKST